MRRLRTLEGLLLAVLLGALLLLGLVQILLRNLFDSGLVWAEPAQRLLLFWLALAAAVAAGADGRQLAVDVLARALAPPWRRRVQLLAALATALACAVLAWYTGRFALDEWRYGGRLAGVPTGLAAAAMPLAFTALTWIEIRRARRAWREGA
ncbi:MAG: hypothetical protein KatS3mg121_1042 [Gammaproteobacteria bacterium]|nr:MAG: hypothetical protein KatS3mg121_1042 [Gammaproteobacteria bacterium]